MAKAKGKHGLSFEKKNHDVLKLPKREFLYIINL
jgi:hypothetical protein